MRSRAIEAYKTTLQLTDVQHEILVGILLGDACLETQNGGRTYRVKFEQSIRHGAYVHHLYSAFREWVLTPPRAKTSRTREHVPTMNLAFQTVSHEAFSEYAVQFYGGGRKRVPLTIAEQLTPRALAYWFMDDGSMKSRQSKGVVLNTQAFKPEDIGRLVDALGALGLRAAPRRQPDGLQIYISGSSYENFVTSIDPYVIGPMRYKVPPARRTTLPKR